MNFGSASLKYRETKHGGIEIGEFNAENKPHGRNITISAWGNISMNYKQNGGNAPGNDVSINAQGDIYVDQVFLKDGQITMKGIEYKNDGTCEEFEL